jgi:hypothetical protein
MIILKLDLCPWLGLGEENVAGEIRSPDVGCCNNCAATVPPTKPVAPVTRMVVSIAALPRRN